MSEKECIGVLKRAEMEKEGEIEKITAFKLLLSIHCQGFVDSRPFVSLFSS